MGFGSRAFLAAGLGFAAAFAVACGSTNGLLTSNQSSTLAGQLNSISSALASHQCGQAANAATALNDAVANLPSSVSGTLLQNLGQGAGTVGQLATQDCTTTATVTSTPTTTSRTTTPTSSSSSTTTTSTSTTTTSSTTTPPSSTTTGATNTSSTGTSTTSNGGAGIGGTNSVGTGTGQGNGGNGAGGGNGQ